MAGRCYARQGQEIDQCRYMNTNANPATTRLKGYRRSPKNHWSIAQRAISHH
jgi:hypothetical protein